MAKRYKKRHKKDGKLDQVCRTLRIELDELFLAARNWVNRTPGTFIKLGDVGHALRKYLRSGWVPPWLTSYLESEVLVTS